LLHCPASFCGLSDSSWYLACVVVTEMKLQICVEQQSSRPHDPIPPILPASCRAPIWRISILTRNSSASTFISCLKSTLSSAI
jgi:hypothetical protein